MMAGIPTIRTAAPPIAMPAIAPWLRAGLEEGGKEVIISALEEALGCQSEG